MNKRSENRNVLNCKGFIKTFIQIIFGLNSITKIIIVIGFLAFGNTKVNAQSCSCDATVPIITIDLSASADTNWTISNTALNGMCCSASGADQCVTFNVTVNSASDLLNFQVLNPAPVSGFYQVNCGQVHPLNSTTCIIGQQTFCITFCQASGGTFDFIISTSRTVNASADLNLTSNCNGNMSVSGLFPSTINWTSIYPGAQGQYNSFLSCTSSCTNTTVTPISPAPSYIDYKVSGSAQTACKGAVSDTVRIYVFPELTASISTSSSIICSGSSDSVSLTVNASGGNPPYSYSWNTGETSQSINVATTGTFYVSITDNTNACIVVTASTVITENPIPSVPVITSNSPVCLGASINFSAVSDTNSIFSWTGPNGFTSSDPNPVITGTTLLNDGNYSLYVTINGCISLVSNAMIDITDIPTIYSLSSNSPVCEGQSLNLTTNSAVNTNYSWTGPGGFVSQLQNPSISISNTLNEGMYTVSQTNMCGTSLDSAFVTINNLPIVTGIYNNGPLCANSTLQLGIDTIVGATYLWTGPNSFSSSLQNTTVTNFSNLNAGTYSVIADNGCSSLPIMTTVYEIPTPTLPQIISNSPICLGDNFILSTNAVNGASYIWNGPNGFSSNSQNNTIPFSSVSESGYYHLSIVVDGCSSLIDSVNVIVNLPSVSDAGIDQVVCSNSSSVQLSGSISGGTSSGIWSTNGTGSFSPSSSFLNASYITSFADTALGIVTLFLTSTGNGACVENTDSLTIAFSSSQIVFAGNDFSVCANNSSIELNGIISNSGDGIWTSNTNGSFTDASQLSTNYTLSSTEILNGSVALTLTSLVSGVCTAVNDVINISISNSPIVNAGADIYVCSGFNIANLAGNISSAANTGMWTSLGTGSFSPLADVLTCDYILSDQDTISGSIFLILESTNNGLCNAVTDSVLISIVDNPIAFFPYSNICSGLPLQFLDSSTSNSGILTTWNWDFANGDYSMLQNPSEIYSLGGDYPVELTVTSEYGCIDSITNVIHVNPSPNVNFTFIDGCVNDVFFTNTSAIDSGTIDSFVWDFGDGNISSDSDPMNSYIDTGLYQVTLTALSDSLCSISLIQTVKILIPPIAGFSWIGTCGSTIYDFSDTSLVFNDTIVSWEWSFTNGVGANQPDLTYDFIDFGLSAAQLIVTTAEDCKDTLSVSFSSCPNPIADFTPPGGEFTINETINFNGLPNEMTSWAWDFGDTSGTACAQNVSYLYENGGYYTVLLTVTDSLGCKDTASYILSIVGIVGVPLGFTPNGDGVNDILYVRGGPITGLTFIIYNEWGNEIFMSYSQDIGWDGKFKGEDQPGGEYVYQINAFTFNNELIQKVGHFTLIR